MNSLRIPRLTRIVTVSTLAILILGSLFTLSPSKEPASPISVSYNPAPLDHIHSPLSGMGLVIASNATTSSSNPGVSGRIPVRSGGQSIRQNGVRFITDGSYFPQTETSIAVDPKNTNHVVAGFNDLKHFFCPDLPADCGSDVSTSTSGFSVSIDGGKTVLKSGDLPQLVFGRFKLTPYGDPSVTPTTDGNFFYASLGFDEVFGRNGILIAKSNQNLFDPTVSCTTPASNRTINACWSETFVWGNAFFPGPTIEDKDRIAVDYDPASPFYGSVYIAWDHFFIFSGSVSYMARCAPDLSSCQLVSGYIYAVVSGFDEFATFTTPAVGKDGTVYVTWCNFGTFSTFGPIICSFRSSLDGGSSFGPTSTVLSFMGPGTMLPNATATLGWATEQYRTANVPSLAVDTNSGNLYFTIQVCTSGYYDAFPSTVNPFVADDNPGNCGGSAIIFQKSIDGGTTWSSPVNLAQRAVNDQPYVTVDQTTGSVYLFYYTTQYDPFNHRIDVVALKSIDGGIRWRQSRVTTVSNEPDSDPNMFTYFSQSGGSLSVPQYGDYFEAMAVGGTVWVLFTANYAVEMGTFQTDPFLIVIRF